MLDRFGSKPEYRLLYDIGSLHCPLRKRINLSLYRSSDPSRCARLLRKYHSHDACAEVTARTTIRSPQNLLRHPDSQSHTAQAVICNQGDTSKKKMPVFGTAPTRRNAPQKQQGNKQRKPRPQTGQTLGEHEPGDQRPRQEDKQTHTGAKTSPGRKHNHLSPESFALTVLGKGPSFFARSLGRRPALWPSAPNSSPAWGDSGVATIFYPFLADSVGRQLVDQLVATLHPKQHTRDDNNVLSIQAFVAISTGRVRGRGLQNRLGSPIIITA